MWNFFEYYLKNRVLHDDMKIYDNFNEPLSLTKGVPQGTVLVPILFLLYLNNIFDISEFKENITSYADDTAIIFVDSLKKVQNSFSTD